MLRIQCPFFSLHNLIFIQPKTNIMTQNKTNQTIENETTLRLLSRTEQHYNARGQVFRSEQSIIDSKNGQVKRKIESQT
jgi:hypothetical protein